MLLIYLGLHLILRSKPLETPGIVSHRGAGGLAPENTLEAIREALKQGAAYTEVDVQRSADNVLVLMHDETVNRTTNGTGRVANLDWQALSKLDAGSYFSEQFTGALIPTLESTLELLKGKPITLVLEIKFSKSYPNIEQDITKMLEKHKMTKEVIVVSFDVGDLKKLHQHSVDIPLGFISFYPFNPPHIQENQTVGVYWSSIIFDPTLIPRLHAKGYHVWVWTANNTLLMRFLIWKGVDGITTDRPDVWNKLKGLN